MIIQIDELIKYGKEDIVADESHWRLIIAAKYKLYIESFDCFDVSYSRNEDLRLY
jgi:hypothetical protein